VVSGLVLNFVPDPALAAREMTRVARPGGRVAAYVWDYAGRMELIRHFWDAAAALDPAAAELDEGRRFGLCQPEPLGRLFRDAGLADVGVRPIEVATRFRDFDDYWDPFLGGQGPAPGYAMSLDEPGRGPAGGAPRPPARRPRRFHPTGRPGLGGRRHPPSVLTACLDSFISIF
jgi:SAM-dependent methyltransferase